MEDDHDIATPHCVPNIDVSVGIQTHI